MEYIKINTGDKYGCYTVLGQSDKKGNQEFYNVLCDCGNQYVIGKSRLRTKPTRCKKCFGKDYASMMNAKRKEMIGKVINGFRIIDISHDNSSGENARFITKCTNCGHQSIKTIRSMKYKNRKLRIYT